jgi:hypothetical protein
MVEAVVDALTTGRLPAPSELAATLAPAIAGGHLRLWSPEAEPEALFERIGADGALGPADADDDFIELVTQSASESKIDFFLRRALTYEPTVNPETGALTATATVTLTNIVVGTEASAGMSPLGMAIAGASSYVLGETTGPTARGENELRLTLYSPHRPTGVLDAEGNEVGVNIAEEKGLFAVTVLVELPPRTSTTFTFSFEGSLPPSTGSYSLDVGRQPAIVGDRVEVALRGADGWSSTGGRETLDGEADTAFTARLKRT